MSPIEEGPVYHNSHDIKRQRNHRLSNPQPTRSFLMGWIVNAGLLCSTVLMLAATVRIIIWMF